MSNAPKIPDWYVSSTTDNPYPMGLAAHEGGFIVLQLQPSGRWTFVTFLPGRLVQLIAETMRKQR